MENENIIEESEKEELQTNLSMAVAGDSTYKKMANEFAAIEKILLSSFTDEQKKMFEEYDRISCEQEEYARMFYYKKGLGNREVGE